MFNHGSRKSSDSHCTIDILGEVIHSKLYFFAIPSLHALSFLNDFSKSE